METISACIIVRNEENNIRDCLESIRWVDEILVVDAFSEDKTVSICMEYTKQVLKRSWTGFYDQVSYAIHSARNPWILYIEADERISPELKQEIQGEFGREKIIWDGFSIPRLTHFLGRWIYHGSWYPDRLYRIFRKNRLVLAGPDPHLKMRVNGLVRPLQGHLLHYTGQDMSTFLRKMDHYTASIAHSKRQSGKSCRPWDLIIRPPAHFMKNYFLKAGFLDGKQGFIVAVLGSFYVFTKYLKLLELQQTGEGSEKLKGK